MKVREGTALWDFHSIRAEEKNWLFAEEKTDICRLGIGSLPAWTGGGSREELVRGAIQNPLKHRKSCACLELEINFSLGQSGTEQVVLSRKGCDSVTRHDRGGGRQSMTSARMEITSAAAWGHSLSCHLIALPGRAEGHSSFPLQFHLASFFFLLFLSP